MPRASERYWSAVVEKIEDIASEREWPAADYRDYWTVVSNLCRETQDSELIDLLASAQALERNFYEDYIRDDFTMSHYVDRAHRLVEKLEALRQ